MDGDKRTIIADYVRRFGNSSSIALFDPACQFFSVPTIDGLIGYRLEAKCIVVFGDPLCAAPDAHQLTDCFHQFCKKKSKNVVYLGATERFMQGVLERMCHTAIEIGDEIVINPQYDPLAQTGQNARRLRNKYNHAQNSGIIVKEYKDSDPSIEQSMKEIADNWIAGRKGPQLYLSEINIFADPEHKRWFYAEQQGRIIAVVYVNRLDMYNGWVLNRFMLAPDVPYGSSEYIVLSLMSLLRAEGCPFFSIGTTPASNIGRIHGLGKMSKWVLCNAYKFAKKILHLNSRQRYWDKFQPTRAASFLLFSKTRIGVREIIGILKAVNIKMRTKKRKKHMCAASPVQQP